MYVCVSYCLFACIPMCIHVCMHLQCVSSYMNVCVHVCIHTCMHTRMCVLCVYSCLYACMGSHTYMCAHEYVRMCTFMHITVYVLAGMRYAEFMLFACWVVSLMWHCLAYTVFDFKKCLTPHQAFALLLNNLTVLLATCLNNLILGCLC